MTDNPFAPTGAADRGRALGAWWSAAIALADAARRETARLDADVRIAEARGLHRLAADLRGLRQRFADLCTATEAARAAWPRDADR